MRARAAGGGWAGANAVCGGVRLFLARALGDGDLVWRLRGGGARCGGLVDDTSARGPASGPPEEEKKKPLVVDEGLLAERSGFEPEIGF